MQRITKQKHLLGKVSIDGSHTCASSWPLFDTVRFIHRPLHQAFGPSRCSARKVLQAWCLRDMFNFCSILPWELFDVWSISNNQDSAWEHSTWLDGRACGPLRATDPIPHLQPVLPYSHTHICGLFAPLVLELGGPAGLFGIFLGSPCRMTRLGFRAVILQVTYIQHTS